MFKFPIRKLVKYRYQPFLVTVIDAVLVKASSVLNIKSATTNEINVAQGTI